jgi:hypothetical protein
LRSRTRARSACLAAVGLLCFPVTIALRAAPARADGDPASDVLLGQDVFLPYSSISAITQRRLFAVASAAKSAGYPIKIALIGAKTDLGVLPSLFGKPESYARFLSSELNGVVAGPVLVVMPAGFGLAVEGRARSTTSLNGIPIGPGADGLGTAALTATERLAAAAGHPLPAEAATASSNLGASSATIQHAVVAIGILALIAAAGIGAGLRARTEK